jgi:hypothetical protein
VIIRSPTASKSLPKLSSDSRLYRLFFHSGSEHFSSRILEKKKDEKVKTIFFHASYGFRKWFQEEVFKVKKISHSESGSRIRKKSSRIRKKFILDPDPQHWFKLFISFVTKPL